MKKECIYICTVLMFLFSTNIKAQILLVPEIEQEENQWCWAGVSKCILDYYGFVQQQCIIAEYARSQNIPQFGNTDCCTSPVSCNNWNWSWGANGSIEDILLNFGGITTTNLGFSLTQTQWQAEINNNTPFVVRIGWNNGGGHFVVGYGISGSDYYTMDPWFNEGFTISTYNWVVTGQGGAGAWTHSQTLSPSPVTSGCTDSIACNYNTNASIDDGSCVYSVVWQQAPTICLGTYYTIGNSSYNISGNYTDTLSILNGCDSIIYTSLTVNNPPVVTILPSGIDLVVSGAQTYLWNTSENTGSITPTTNGLYWCIGTDLTGCISDTVYFEVTSITSISDLNSAKQLFRIINVLGKETPFKKNTPLFFIYDDGTVEKKIIIE
jgi:hypothetical protein